LSGQPRINPRILMKSWAHMQTRNEAVVMSIAMIRVVAREAEPVKYWMRT
jgi:hypothetical protein